MELYPTHHRPGKADATNRRTRRQVHAGAGAPHLPPSANVGLLLLVLLLLLPLLFLLPHWMESPIPRTLPASGVAMFASAPNSEVIRVVVIAAFAVITLVLRAIKKPTPTPPPRGTGVPRANPMDAIREAMRQASDQARTGRPQSPFQSAPPQVRDSFPQPPPIKPESPVLPTLLLVALFVCLCYMAYRYFAQ